MKSLLHTLYIIFALILGALCGALPAGAAESRVLVKGLVRDSVDHSPVPFAAVGLAGTGVGGMTNEQGVFELYTDRPFTAITVGAVGYTPKRIPAPRSGMMTVINLVPEGVALGEVTVKQKRGKYRKKDNPALEIIEQIRAGADGSDPNRLPYYSFNEYERVKLGINNYDPDHLSGLLKLLPAIRNLSDTSSITGATVLTLSNREKVAQVHHRSNPEDTKTLVLGLKSAGIDQVADPESMRKFFDDIMREIDIYSNDIPLLRNRFVSPLSRLAPDFYKFYLTDTVAVESDTCVVVTFLPHNPAVFGFTGSLYVVKDDPRHFIRKVSMRVPKGINLNYVNALQIEQMYDRAEDGSRLKRYDKLAIEASMLPGMPEVYAERSTTYSNHNFNLEKGNPGLFRERADVITLDNAENRDSVFWRTENPDGRVSHLNADQLMRQLRANKFFYWSEKVLKLLTDGYIPTGKPSKFDIGPINSLFSYNSLEGPRVRLGGMTTASLNDHIFMRGYGAYGFGDKRWKYGGELEYSFTPKKLHSREFPIHSIAGEYINDIDKIAQNYMFSNPDNFFLSLTRHPNHQIIYKRTAALRYTMELHNHFSVTARLRHDRREASKYIGFTDGYGHTDSHYDQSSLEVELRYAPGEKFYQGRTHRLPINIDAPVVTLSHRIGPGGVFGSRYTLNVTEASLMKRFWFSAWGYTDIIIKGGHVWSRVDFPDLLIPNANLTYFVQPESFALMKPMEFINDSYVSWDLTYWANGAIFNYIPVFKRMKLREVFSFRGVWGKLSDKNNPEKNPGLYVFPAENHTMPMGSTPYMEIGIGLDNILTFLRVDYMWRLTYRDTPGCSRSGVQFSFHFTF
ncbi:MAG: DUF5686 and carboxypeptidase regulatory-like domain-containing protein [Candidatus Amulumruptor caecigallinarius]|nr:DUF5686 and carboxypeptidase regulatory-like domain-containing protein [Candidatus Amulumruptor caecigallinarius]MCM1396812.1 DUF5686 and carboxypeptidase regulatory-like domain-containing protein [Candidatus Amulumruptor caecigallinarius]MCM1454244.1 DUF5686 and carboxypeptidase regulatory-like domain-containing protein [bacterium]